MTAPKKRRRKPIAVPAPPPEPEPAPRRAKGRAAQSFRADEVEAMVTLLGTLMRGGDGTLIARSPVLQGVYAKFVRMKQKLEKGP